MRMFVSLGSNVEPLTHLRRAVAELHRRFTVTAVSPVYRTAPVGDVDQPEFWNMAVELECQESPEHVHEILRGIETLLGRRRDPGRPCGPRTVDLDLVLVEGVHGSFGSLNLPSPLVEREPFVAVPVADLAPDLPHPVSSVPLGQLARSLVAGAAAPPAALDVEIEP
jgi:2-amino-4-hydroxy-6-hydroxymethyldihydropteridine diphosphokinase